MSKKYREFIVVTINLQYRIKFTETIINHIRVCIIMILVAINFQLIKVSSGAKEHSHLVQAGFFIHHKVGSHISNPVVHLTCNLNSINLFTIRIISKSIKYFIALFHRHIIMYTFNPKRDYRHLFKLLITIDTKNLVVFAQFEEHMF